MSPIPVPPLPARRRSPLPSRPPRGQAPLLVSALAVALLLPGGPGLPSPAAAQGPRPSWELGVGVGVAVDLTEMEQSVDAPGLATQAVLRRRSGDGRAWALQWDGSWFDGRYATEKRFLVSAVREVPVGGSGLRVRGGPGLGLVTVVEVDFPEPGTVGDGLVAVGDTGAWGVVAGMTGRLPLGRILLEPDAGLLWQRVGDGDGGHHHPATLTVGGRLLLGG